MKSYFIQPDLTVSGLKTLSLAVQSIMTDKCKRVDLGCGTVVYRVPSNNPKKFTVRIDMKIEEE